MILIFLFNVKDNKPFFSVVNKELLNINDWLTSNKPSLNVEKAEYSFIHEPVKKDNIPLCLSKLIINNYEVRRIYHVPEGSIRATLNIGSTKIKLTKNKSAKNIAILYKARPSSYKRALDTTNIFTHS